MQDIRCNGFIPNDGSNPIKPCNSLLFKIDSCEYRIEAKCRRCKTMNVYVQLNKTNQFQIQSQRG